MAQKPTSVGPPFLSMSSGSAAASTIPPLSGSGPRTLASYGSTDTLRPASSSGNGISVTVDRPTTPQVATHSYTSIPRRGRPALSIAPVYITTTCFRSKLSLHIGQFASSCISSFFLCLVVAWACLARLSHEIPRWLKKPVNPPTFHWDKPEYVKNEKVVKDVQTYARAVGFEIINEQVETGDGYYLRVHRVVNPRRRPFSDGRGGFPVLILHGLFQSSGSFITSEERSLAFWLSEQGYQVFLGNNRAVFNMGHKNFSRSDPRFWDWTIRELAMYDLPALVDYVRDATGYEKIAFIGHSQGNGLAFISLCEGICPQLGEKLSCFIALAPAVFSGPLTQGFPFTLLARMDWNAWKRVFGVLDFIPLMQWSYEYVPSKIFAVMGYTMFAFLFHWTDTNWLKRRKTKMFRFTPSPVSSASIFWWCGKGGFADRRCTMDVTLPRWFDPCFPPLSLFYGGRDFLVLVEPLLERIERQEPHIRLIRVEKIDASEHCDFYWAADAVEWCFSAIMEDIERTRPPLHANGIILN